MNYPGRSRDLLDRAIWVEIRKDESREVSRGHSTVNFFFDRKD